MRSIFASLSVLCLCGIFTPSRTLLPAGEEAEDGFVPLFNGRDLSGWRNVNCSPSTWSVRDGIIISTGKPAGVLCSEKQYENFVLELEWSHRVPKGNAGLFIWSDPITARGQPFTRSIEVQVMDGVETPNYTSHGDIFSIHGARMKPDRPHPGGWERCLPSERRAKPSPEWNQYRVTCIDGTLKLAVNGKEVSGGSEIRPRKGYICLESEGSECHFRNIRIKELPPSKTPLKPEEVAAVHEGFRSLYTGADFSGWKLAAGGEGHWKVRDWSFEFDGKGETLRSEKDLGDFTLIADWQWPAKPADASLPIVFTDVKLLEVVAKLTAGAEARSGEWNRLVLTRAGQRATIEVNGQKLLPIQLAPGAGRTSFGLGRKGSAARFANIYLKEP